MCKYPTTRLGCSNGAGIPMSYENLVIPGFANSVPIGSGVVGKQHHDSFPKLPLFSIPPKKPCEAKPLE